MIEPSTGTPTLHTRVDAWECDFNGHWNSRFYCRSFETAVQVGAALQGDPDPAGMVASGWHVRFHSELRAGDPVMVRSFDLAPSGREGSAAHVMTSHGRVAATAIDQGLPRRARLARLPDALGRSVLPRGITSPPARPWEPDPDRDCVVELGPVRADETHPDGTSSFESAMARLSSTTHHHAMQIGFTPEATERTGIGRMLVEMRYTVLGTCAAGTFLRGATRLVEATGKSFVTMIMFHTHDGTPVGLFELCTLAVDMNSRRATDLPDFVIAQMSQSLTHYPCG